MNPFRLLVVEDEGIVAMDVESRLAAMGYELAGRAVTGEEAVKLVEQERPDLILMDIRLQGDMDGITAAEEIRRRYQLPVIFLTAYSEDTTLDRAKLAEPYGYIFKPFDDRELKSTIEIALHKHRAESEILRLNRLYDVLSHVGQAIVHTNSREELLQTVCRIVVERSVVDLAWILRLDSGLSPIEVVAQFGDQSERLTEAWRHVESRFEGWGDLGSSLRAGEPFVCHECGLGKCPHPLKTVLCELEFRSCGSFPLSFQGQIWGVLNICVSQPGYFRDREMQVLKEVATDISFGLDRLESESRRVQAEEALRRSREDYRNIFENAVVGIHRTTPEGRFLSANPMAARLLGYESPEELIRQVTDLSTQIYVNPHDREEAARLMREQGCIKDFEVQCRRRDGTLGWGSLSAYAVRDDEGQVLYIEGTSLDISERKRIEKELRAGEEKYRNIVTLSSDGIFETDDKGVLTFANEAHARILGFEQPEDVVGRSIFELVFPPDRERLLGIFHGALSSGEAPAAVELTVVRPDGGRVEIEVRPSLVTKKDGTIASIGVMRDVTERKRMLKEEREAQEKYRSIFEGALEGIFRTSISGQTLVCNPAAARILGYETPEEALETITGLKKHVWVDQNQRAEYLRRLEEDDIVHGFESQFFRKDRSKIWLSLDSRAIRGADGRIAFIESLFEDITKRKRDEEILSARLRLMEFATSHSMEELLQKSIDEAESITESAIGFYHFLESDQRTIQLQTWSRRTLNDFCQAEGRGLHYSLDAAGVWADCIRNRSPLVHNDLADLPNRKGMPTGHAHVVRELVVPVFRGESIVAVLGVGNKPTDYDEADVTLVSQLADLAWDIVEHKRSEEQILHLSYQNELILGAVMEGIIGTDSNGNITFVNPSGAHHLGYEKDELLGKRLHQTVHHSRHDGTPYAEVDCPMMQSLARGKSFSVRDEVLWRKDGTSFPVSYTSAPILESGNIVGAVVGFRDITDLRLASEKEVELKAQLNHIQKMEAIGTMAGGIAHDFNNILAPIIGYTELALDEARESATLKRFLDQVLVAAYRAKDLVGHILAFSRRGEAISKKPMDISVIIKEALKLLRASLPSTIEIRQNLANGLVEADPTQIHQVFVNLCTNAAHAMEDKGVLDVSLTTVNLDSPEIGPWFSLSGLKPGPHVKLSVADTGHGMDEETVRRIFEPYFTTKEVGKGTGLGLAVVHGIIKNHGGEITVRSEPGKGSVFDVYLPMLPGEPVSLSVQSSPLPGGSERVLLVDDEETIAQMGAAMLGRLGYDVTVKTSSRDAFTLFLANPEAFDVVITDFTMPEMTGTELAQEIRKVRPDIPIILCTGFSEKVTAGTAQDLGLSGFAMKPLGLRELAELLRSVLPRERSGDGSPP